MQDRSARKGGRRTKEWKIKGGRAEERKKRRGNMMARRRDLI